MCEEWCSGHFLTSERSRVSSTKCVVQLDRLIIKNIYYVGLNHMDYLKLSKIIAFKLDLFSVLLISEIESGHPSKHKIFV